MHLLKSDFYSGELENRIDKNFQDDRVKASRLVALAPLYKLLDEARPS